MVMRHAYWGEEYGEGDIKAFLEGAGIKYEYFADDDKLLNLVAESITKGQVVGWLGLFLVGIKKSSALEPQTGIEPVTSSLPRTCSTD